MTQIFCRFQTIDKEARLIKILWIAFAFLWTSQSVFAGDSSNSVDLGEYTVVSGSFGGDKETNPLPYPEALEDARAVYEGFADSAANQDGMKEIGETVALEDGEQQFLGILCSEPTLESGIKESDALEAWCSFTFLVRETPASDYSEEVGSVSFAGVVAEKVFGALESSGESSENYSEETRVAGNLRCVASKDTSSNDMRYTCTIGPAHLVKISLSFLVDSLDSDTPEEFKRYLKKVVKDLLP
jgi:hypothetical protein